jgi:hypothetical protein
MPTPGATGGCLASGAPFSAPPNADPVSGTSQTLQCDISQPGCKPNANVVVDGDGAAVKCTVSGGGDVFNVSGVLSAGTVGFSVQSTSLGPTGGKAFVSSDFNQFAYNDPNCDIFIEPNMGQIIPGAIWARFECKQFGDQSTGQRNCTATGKFIFENCTK